MKKVLEIVNKYLKEISREIRVEEAYLFGSSARGERLETSDVDLLIISSDVEGLTLDERIHIAYKHWPYDVSGDIILLSPKEYEKLRRRSIVLRDAERYWIKIV